MSNAKFDPRKLTDDSLDNLETGNSLPILRLLQKGSAEVDESHENYPEKGIEGAKAGMIVFGPTSDIYKEVTIIPLAQKTLYAQWRPKSKGGGLVGHRGLDVVTDPDYRKGDKNKEFLGEDELHYTIYVMVLFLDKDGEWQRAMIPFTSTGLSVARRWNKQLRGFQYPEADDYKGMKPLIFSQTWTLGSEPKKNNEGSWFAFKLEPKEILHPDNDIGLLQMAYETSEEAKKELPAAEDIKQIEEEPF